MNLKFFEIELVCFQNVQGFLLSLNCFDIYASMQRSLILIWITLVAHNYVFQS